MEDRDMARSGAALSDFGADGAGIEVSWDEARPLDWVHQSPVHGEREISYYEVSRFSEEGCWVSTVSTVVWLADREPLAIESEVRDPKILEAVLNAYELGRKAARVDRPC